ncbi:MAG TPA: fimbrial protein [Xanthomonadales bacterium]|nr:fimbrial protein [Xanthomonadales bacterium]
MKPKMQAAVARLVRAGIVVLYAATLVACARGTSDLEAWATEVRNRPPPALEPLPVMQQFETFEYDAERLRDPFSAPQDNTQVASGPRPDPNRRKETLEAFPLDSLDMVGTLTSGSVLWGLVMAPDRVVHRVRGGNYLGQNEGRILTVAEDRIEVMELVPDGAGGWIERPASIALEDQ